MGALRALFFFGWHGKAMGMQCRCSTGCTAQCTALQWQWQRQQQPPPIIMLIITVGGAGRRTYLSPFVNTVAPTILSESWEVQMQCKLPPPCSPGSARSPRMCVFLGERIVFVPGAAMNNLYQNFLFHYLLYSFYSMEYSVYQAISHCPQDKTLPTTTRMNRPVDK
jgi:hypothetical protein